MAVAAAGGALALGAGVAFAASGGAFAAAPPPPAAAVEHETAAVERGDLTQTVRASGKLGYGAERGVSSVLEGTLTWLPAVRDVVKVGDRIAAVDEKPIFAFRGDVPAWRDFTRGMSEGTDVRQVQDSLRALGFDPGETDGKYGWKTAQAVRDWQKSVGLERTGTIERGRIVMLPWDARVTGLDAEIGTANAGVFLRVAQNRLSAAIELPADQQAGWKIGADVALTVTGGAQVEGTVASFGDAQDKQSDGTTKLVVPAKVDIEDQSAVAGRGGVGVTSEVTAVLAKDALLVPVLALSAKPGGGSSVLVASGGKTARVPVDVTQVANGLAAVTSENLHEGDRVVTGR